MQNFLPLNKDQLLTFEFCCVELELKYFRAEGHQNIQFSVLVCLRADLAIS